MHRGCRLRIGLALTLSSAASLADARSQAGGAVPTTAAVASLVSKPLGTAEQGVLREALRTPAPETRAVAARVARVQGAKELVPALREAVTTEPDVAVAREEMLALGWLAGLTEQDSLFTAASRFEGSLDDAR